MRAVLDAGHDFPLCGTVRAKLVGNHHAWNPPLDLQQLTHQALEQVAGRRSFPLCPCWGFGTQSA